MLGSFDPIQSTAADQSYTLVVHSWLSNALPSILIRSRFRHLHYNTHTHCVYIASWTFAVIIASQSDAVLIKFILVPLFWCPLCELETRATFSELDRFPLRVGKLKIGYLMAPHRYNPSRRHKYVRRYKLILPPMARHKIQALRPSGNKHYLFIPAKLKFQYSKFRKQTRSDRVRNDFLPSSWRIKIPPPLPSRKNRPAEMT